MPRRRIAAKGRKNVTRARLSDEFEAFLAGDNAALSDDELLRALVAECVFVKIAGTQLSHSELKRLDKLEERHREWRTVYERDYYRGLAKAARVLHRYMLLEESEGPSGAFCQAIGPGPNSVVRDIPRDDEIAKGAKA